MPLVPLAPLALFALAALPAFVASTGCAPGTAEAEAGASVCAGGSEPLPALAGVCAAAGADTASAAASTHDAHDMANIRGEISTDPSTEHAADTRKASGERDEKRDENSGDSGEPGNRRETKRKPRRLRDKEIGNVVEGQRNMPEILSPCG